MATSTQDEDVELLTPSLMLLFVVAMWLPIFITIMAPLPWNTAPGWWQYYPEHSDDHLPRLVSLNQRRRLCPFSRERIELMRTRLYSYRQSVFSIWCLLVRLAGFVACVHISRHLSFPLHKAFVDVRSSTQPNLREIIMIAHGIYTVCLGASLVFMVLWICHQVTLARQSRFFYHTEYEEGCRDQNQHGMRAYGAPYPVDMDSVSDDLEAYPTSTQLAHAPEIR
jgi:hypothetical protein